MIRTTAQSRAAKGRGLKAANAIAGVFAVFFPAADRKVQKGAEDEGDICGVPDLTIEAKDHRHDSLPGWLDEAVAEALHGGTAWHVVAHKRYGKGDAGDWFATMRLGTFAAMYARLQVLELAEARRRHGN